MDLDLSSGKADPQPQQTSIASVLRQRIAERLKPQPITVTIPEVEGMTVTYDPTGLTVESLGSYRERAGIDPRSDEQPSAAKATSMMAMILADRCIGFAIDGKDYLDDSGERVTFSSPVIHEMLGTNTWTDAVIALYGSSGDVISTGGLLLERAGLGDRVKTVNP